MKSESTLLNPTLAELKALRLNDYLVYAHKRDLDFPANSRLVVDFMFLYAGNIVENLSVYEVVDEYKKLSPQNGFDRTKEKSSFPNSPPSTAASYSPA